jgi:hypothetical protein
VTAARVHVRDARAGIRTLARYAERRDVDETATGDEEARDLQRVGEERVDVSLHDLAAVQHDEIAQRVQTSDGQHAACADDERLILEREIVRRDRRRSVDHDAGDRGHRAEERRLVVCGAERDDARVEQRAVRRAGGDRCLHFPHIRRSDARERHRRRVAEREVDALHAVRGRVRDRIDTERNLVTGGIHRARARADP